MPGKADEQATSRDATRETSIDADSCISNKYKHISSADSTELGNPLFSNALLPVTLGSKETISNLACPLKRVSHTQMTSFARLPTELTIYISECLHLSNIVNFALVHKQFFAIASPLLEKRRKCIESYVVFRHSDSHMSVNIPYLLNEIAKDPNIAYYVRHLTIRGWADKDHVHWKPSFKYTSEVWTSIRSLINESNGIPEHEKADWISSAEQDGDQEPLVALLLLQLTHVETITLECPWHVPMTMLPKTVDFISTTPSNKALRRLHTVTLDFSDAFGPNPMLAAFSGMDWVRSTIPTPYNDDWASGGY